MTGYIPQKDRKKILFLADDIRLTSGISTIAREIVVGTAHRFNWVNLGAAIQHPDNGKRLDICDDTNKLANLQDSSIFIYAINGYGSADTLRQLINVEKPDAIIFFTDPRYWTWLFQIENEIRRSIPMIYLSIWDDYPAPIYNKSFYESCDTLMCISAQTQNMVNMVLGDKVKNKIVKYIPHGINEKIYFPITEFMVDKCELLSKRKKEIFKDFDPEFIVFYNARNIRRKCTPDLIAAYALFCDTIGKEKASKCVLLLHTQVIDENGTNLQEVADLLCDPDYQKVCFNDSRIPAEELNLLYNMADVTCLVSSNEGWGLSLTESMMCGKMIIGNVTGGMQDQMRFENEAGEWVKLTPEFPSNHYGTYKKHGEWAVPVYPSNLSIVGSIPTPYIFDDRCDFRDIAKAIQEVYNLPYDERNKRGMSGRKWVLSSESMMSSAHMSDNIVETVETTIGNFKPRKKFELIKTEKLLRKKLLHPLIY